MESSNPWAVDSLNSFNYYCCPECDLKSHSKQAFVNHAFQKHPDRASALYSIKDQTVQGIKFPIKQETEHDEVKVESDIKDEIEINFDTCDQIQDDDPMDDYDLDVADKLEDKLKCEPKKEILCRHCDLKFPTKYDLFMHKLHDHGPKVTKKVSDDTEECLCSLCGKTIIGRKKFIRHEKERHGINIKPRKISDFNCVKCNKSIIEAVEADEHMKECQKVSKNFPCPECDLLWVSGPSLSYHLRKDHSRIQSFICDHCGKCFKQKVGHDNHVKAAHDNIKDHVCHLCGLGFTRKQALQYHISRIHKDSGKHFCDRCPFKAILKRDLEIHINEVHTKAIKFACDHCNFFCYRKGGLAAHIKNVHLKLRPHKCESCGHAFVRRKELEKHKETTNH